MATLPQRLWQSYWHLICHQAELPSPGDFVRFQVLGKELVVFNDQGELLAFDNRCPHRGTRIFLEFSGNHALTCPYHGWTFHAGKVIIPGAEAFTGCDLSKVDLNRYKIDRIGDFIFASVAPQQSLDEQVGVLRSILEDISFGVQARHDLNSYDYDCDWKIAVENALEPYHVAMVHPTSLGMLDLQAGHNDFHGRNSVWYSKLGNQRMATQLSRLSKLFHLDYQYEGYMSIYLFPFGMVSSTYGLSYSVQSFFPSSTPDRCHFSSRLLTMAPKDPNKATMLTNFFDSTATVNRQVFAEDNAICRRMPTDSWSPEAPAWHADSEEKVIHFRQSCKRELELLE